MKYLLDKFMDLLVVTAILIAFITPHTVFGSALHVLVDSSLIREEGDKVTSVLQQLPACDRGGWSHHHNIRLHYVPGWNSFDLYTTVKRIKHGSQCWIAVVLWCTQCYDVTATKIKGTRLCSYTCWDAIVHEWTTCNAYLHAIRVFSELLIKTSTRSNSLAIFYDYDKEAIIQPVIDTLCHATKGMYRVFRDKEAKPQEFQIPFINDTLSHIHNFIISTNIQKTALFLKQGSCLNILGPEYNWMIDARSNTSKYNDLLLSEYMQDGDNIAVVSRVESPHSEYARDVLLNSLNDSNGEVRKSDLLHVKKCMSDCTPPRPLTTVAKINYQGDMVNVSHVFPREFEGFHGRYFNIVTLEYDPFIIIQRYANGTPYYTGLCVKLLDCLARQLNFRYNIFDVKDGKFGILENNTWNGMIGEVYRKEVDMAVSGITISAQRDSVVDFTFPFWEEPTAVLVKRTEGDPKLFWIFRPLHWHVWLLLIATIAIVAVLITCFTRISKCKKPLPKYDALYRFHNALWYVFGGFLQQGGYDQPQTLPGQAIAGSWWAVVVVVYGIYTGNLIAFLAITNIPLPFDTLAEMTSQNVYKYGVEDGIIQMMLFQTAEDGIYKKIWDGIKSDPANIVQSGEEGVRKAVKEKYAYMGDKTNLLSLSRQKCELAFIPEEFYKVGFGFAVQEGWRYKKYFDDAIMKLVEGGFVETWRREFWPAETCDLRQQVVGSQAITMENLSGNFAILIFGIAISSILLCCEHIQKLLSHTFSLEKHSTSMQDTTHPSPSGTHCNQQVQLGTQNLDAPHTGISHSEFVASERLSRDSNTQDCKFLTEFRDSEPYAFADETTSFVFRRQSLKRRPIRSTYKTKIAGDEAKKCSSPKLLPADHHARDTTENNSHNKEVEDGSQQIIDNAELPSNAKEMRRENSVSMMELL